MKESTDQLFYRQKGRKTCIAIVQQHNQTKVSKKNRVPILKRQTCPFESDSVTLSGSMEYVCGTDKLIHLIEHQKLPLEHSNTKPRILFVELEVNEKAFS